MKIRGQYVLPQRVVAEGNGALGGRAHCSVVRVAKRRHGGQHLADFATLSHVVSKGVRARRNQPRRLCRHCREGGDRQAKGEGLDCLVRDIARPWWHWCRTRESFMWRYVNRAYKDPSFIY